MDEHSSSGQDLTAPAESAALVTAPASLRVVIGETVRAVSLPPRGEVCVGRGADAHVVVQLPNLSRRHAMLRVGSGRTGLEVCDLASANGTVLGGEPLPPSEWRAVERGDVLLLADATILVHDGLAQHEARRSVGLDDVRKSLERHLRERARHGNDGFDVCVLRCNTTRRWTDVVAGLMLTSDHLAIIGETTAVLVLGARRTREQRVLTLDALDKHLGRLGARAEVVVRRCPEDATDVAGLLNLGDAVVADSRTVRPTAPVARSEQMVRIYALVDEVAATPASVLILGETGTGKEVLARTLHERSPRRDNPFLALNCAALPDNLLESELFGYERGAFTGAVAAKAGLLETAQGGTVFLDELGEMPRTTQAKLLRVLEERAVWRIGALAARKIDVRLVAATNVKLREAIQEGQFRADLYYRINSVTIVLPPLRERLDEIEPFVAHFAKKAANTLGKRAPIFSPEAIHALMAHPWPGNVRELANVVERAVLFARGGIVGVDDLPDELRGPAAPTSRPRDSARSPSWRDTLVEDDTVSHQDSIPPPAPTQRGSNLLAEVEELERQRIVDALARCNGNQTRAAEMLGMTRRILINRLERYNLPRPRKP